MNQARSRSNAIAQIEELDIAQCVVKELGADVNEANEMGTMPLFVAAHKEYLGVVQWLQA